MNFGCRQCLANTVHNCLCRWRWLHQEHKVCVYGVHINVVQVGKGNNAVLLMPGTLGSVWTDFKPQIEGLPTLLPDHTIVAWDPPGYGKSIPPDRKFSLDVFKDDANNAADLMQTLQLGNYSVLGWKAGGTTALIMAGRFPQCIDKLVVWGGGAYITDAEIKALEEKRNLASWSPSTRKVLEDMYGTERLSEMWSNWLDTMCDFNTKRGGDICKTEVDCIQAPTLILRGEDDKSQPKEQVNFLKENLKSSKYQEISGGTHCIHLTHASEFNKLVAQFLLEKQK